MRLGAWAIRAFEMSISGAVGHTDMCLGLHGVRTWSSLSCLALLASFRLVAFALSCHGPG